MEKLKTVIGICGGRLSGKDTAANLLVQNLSGFTKKCLADVLKSNYSEIMDIPLEYLYKQGPVKEEHRIGLITLGAIKRTEDIDHWCKVLHKKNQGKSIVIPDIRFNNEIEYFQNNSNIFILMEIISTIENKEKRGWTASSADTDKSEQERFDFEKKINFFIKNDGTIEQLENQLKQLINFIQKEKTHEA